MAAQFAGRLALIAFAVSCVRGLLVGAAFDGTVKTGLLAAAAFFGLGLVFGELARRVVEESVDAQRRRAADEAAESGT